MDINYYILLDDNERDRSRHVLPSKLAQHVVLVAEKLTTLVYIIAMSGPQCLSWYTQCLQAYMHGPKANQEDLFLTQIGPFFTYHFWSSCLFFYNALPIGRPLFTSRTSRAIIN